MKKVCVMLSSFNGEDFISQQLDCILNQKNVEVNIYIRDDGSNDKTRDIIAEYRKKYSDKIYVEYGENIGWKESFLRLIFVTLKHQEFDYFATSDQDDYWMEDKIFSAIEAIENKYALSDAVLYASNLELVDSELNSLGLLYVDTASDIKSLQELFALGSSPFGCTMVWNNNLNSILLKEKPSISVAYDQWINVVANCQGQVMIDTNSHILHIIHGDNVCGVSRNQIERIKKFFRIYLSPEYVPVSKMIKEYFRIYGEEISSPYANILYALTDDKRYSILHQPEILRLGLKKRMRIFAFCTLGIM